MVGRHESTRCKTQASTPSTPYRRKPARSLDPGFATDGDPRKSTRSRAPSRSSSDRRSGWPQTVHPKGRRDHAIGHLRIETRGNRGRNRRPRTKKAASVGTKTRAGAEGSRRAVSDPLIEGSWITRRHRGGQTGRSSAKEPGRVETAELGCPCGTWGATTTPATGVHTIGWPRRPQGEVR